MPEIARLSTLIPLPPEAETPPGLRLTWVPRASGASLTGLMQGLTPPGTGRFLLFAGERAEAVAARGIAAGMGLWPAEFHAAA